MACVDSEYLDPLGHAYREDAVFRGACAICGGPFNWHTGEERVIKMQNSNLELREPE
jgi:hypothetical protein